MPESIGGLAILLLQVDKYTYKVLAVDGPSIVLMLCQTKLSLGDPDLD